MKFYNDIMNSFPKKLYDKVKLYENFFQHHVTNDQKSVFFPKNMSHLMPDLYKQLENAFPIVSGNYVVDYEANEELLHIINFKNISIDLRLYLTDSLEIVFTVPMKTFNNVKINVDVSKKSLLINQKEYLLSVDSNINQVKLFSILKKPSLKNLTTLNYNATEEIINNNYKDMNDFIEIYSLSTDASYSDVEKQYVLTPLFRMLNIVNKLKEQKNKNGIQI